MHIPKSDRIKKGGSSVLVIVAVATVIVVFCAFSVKALLTQGAYQRRVVNAKHDTVNQLEKNIEAANTMTKQYDVFEAANPNAIGGKSDVADNSVPPDGKNSRIVLDALPTSYDFPALISSLNKLLGMNNITDKAIGGADQPDSFTSKPAANPQPITISQIPVGGSSSYAGIQTLIQNLERSIRPYDVTSFELGGNDSNMSITINLDTYYQPAQAIILESKEVK